MSRTIDLHHHVIPDFYWQASNEDGNAAGGINPPRWSLAGAIAYLDEAEIDVAVPSISTPGVHLGDDAAARTLRVRRPSRMDEHHRAAPHRGSGSAANPPNRSGRSRRRFARRANEYIARSRIPSALSDRPAGLSAGA
jgi:hypothetical protein